MLVETLVISHLTYCVTDWAGCEKGKKRRWQKVLNHCAQTVKGVRRSAHVTPLIRELDWPSIDDLIAERDMGILHWLMKNQHIRRTITTHFFQSESASAQLVSTDLYS